MLIVDLELNVTVTILIISNFFMTSETNRALHNLLLQRLKWELLIGLEVLNRVLECELLGFLI